MSRMEVVAFDRLVLNFAPRPWAFAETRRAEIDAHFATLQRAKPQLWNGRVLLLHRHRLGGGTFEGDYFDTDFASMLAWRDWDFPDRTIHNCFAMAALRAEDGAFLLGVMGAHTANAGKVYFPAGTPEPGDVRGSRVDLEAGLLRELEEETGVTAAEVEPAPGWSAVLAGQRIALMRIVTAKESGEALQARIRDTIARQDMPELADVRLVRGPADLDSSVAPFVVAFVTSVWEQG